MSDPTYRIEVEHDPHVKSAPWYVRVYSLADDRFPQFTGYCASSKEAVVAASDWIKSEGRRKGGFVVYSDDEGNAAEPPAEAHSVKAS